MGNYDDVIMNYEATRGAMMDHIQITEEEAALLKNLDDVHGDLIDYWLGESGEVFRQMASTIEAEVGDAMRFSENCTVGNDQLITNAEELDVDRSNSLETSTDG